jgi:hypothetical protein
LHKINRFTRHETDRFLNNHCQECVHAYLSIHDCLSNLLLKSAFEQIFNVMQLIIVKIKWHIKWKYLIQKFHDICLSYYFNFANGCRSHFLYHGCFMVSIAIFFDWLKPILFYQQVLFWTISDVVNYTELKLILLKFCLFTENTHGKKAQRKISKI